MTEQPFFDLRPREQFELPAGVTLLFVTNTDEGPGAFEIRERGQESPLIEGQLETAATATRSFDVQGRQGPLVVVDVGQTAIQVGWEIG